MTVGDCQSRAKGAVSYRTCRWSASASTLQYSHSHRILYIDRLEQSSGLLVCVGHVLFCDVTGDGFLAENVKFYCL